MLRLASPLTDRPAGPRLPYAIPLGIQAAHVPCPPAGPRNASRLTSLLIALLAFSCLMIIAAMAVIIGMARRHHGSETAGDKSYAAARAEPTEEAADGPKISAAAARVPSTLGTRPNQQTGALPLADRTAARPTDGKPPSSSARPADQQPPETRPAEAAPQAEPAPAKTIVRATAARGAPFGAGKIEVFFGEGERPVLYPDQPILLNQSENRVRFGVVTSDWKDNEETPVQPARRLLIHFLFLGDGPLKVRIATAGRTLLEEVELVPRNDSASRSDLLDQWWQAYGQRVDQLNGTARTVQQLMRRALARRLRWEVPPYPADRLEQRPLAALEQKFERSLSTLLGIDSLLLAVPEPSDRRGTVKREPADRPLPAPVNVMPMRPIRFVTSASVEPIALRVPQNCFFVRCGSLANYAWLRAFVTGWGGSLQEIVSLPTLEHPIRQRLERQLAICLADSQTMGLDRHLADMALIGCDFFFREGAAIGVLFQANDADQLGRILQQQRADARQRHPDAMHHTLQLGAGSPVSLIETPDHRIRSFYARDGAFHLVTNCRQIVQDFLATGRGKGRLGALNEYRYARSKMADRNHQRVFIYLSDPFFRQLASPHYRTEVTRRAEAAADLQELAAARVVAESELGTPVENVARLVSLRYLPAHFGRRADGSRAEWKGGRAVDSRRGCRGTFVPIPDVGVQRLTPHEVAAYGDFARQYRRQWGRVDPVAVTIHAERTAQAAWEEVHVGIYVTPYARQRYAFLARHLAPASIERTRSVPGDVMWINAALRGRTGQAMHVHLGLQDRSIRFHVDHGKLQLAQPLAGGSFANSSQYVAVTPAGTQNLELVQQFVRDLQHGSTSASSGSESSAATLLAFAQLFFGSRTSQLLALMFTSNAITTRGPWTVYARDRQVRHQVLDKLRLVHTGKTAQVHLAVVDPARAQVTKYLHAFAFVESRKASAMNAQLLNDLPQQLGIPAGESVRVVRHICAASPVCPLGGRYVLTGVASRRVWRSTAWHEGSVWETARVPDDYEFPFLRWLRGVDIHFLLSRDTLRADVQLKVQKSQIELPGPTEQASDPVVVRRPTAAQPVRRPAPVFRVGDLVAIAANDASLRLGSSRLTRLRRDQQVTVLEVRGEWVGVEAEIGGTTRRGWVWRHKLGRP